MATTSALQLPPPSQAITIRPARLEDLDRLVQIENRSFTTDRFSRRTFRYLLTRANAVTLVAEAGGKI
ncbi:MAG: hypothetical protein ACK4JF_06230, partial [Methylohalobius sp.]